MARYAVLIFEKVPPEELPPDVMRGHMELPDRIAERGGRVVAGLALEPEATATAIRGDVLTDGPFIETKEALGGIYILEARDLDHALALARMTPIVDGGVEVRPLIDFVVVEAPCAPPPRSPTRTAASGPPCSPRRCASRATSTSPRRRCRTPMSARCGPGPATASPSAPRRGW